MSSLLFAVFGIGQTELLILGIIILLLFGTRLPSVMRSLGRGIVEFKKGAAGIEDDVEETSSKKASNNGGTKEA